MSAQLTMLLTSLFPALLLIVLGYVARTHGPQGVVQGVVDWSKFDEPTRKRAGRLVGNTLFTMATLVVAHDLFRYLNASDAAAKRLGTSLFVGGMCLLIVVMVFGLLRLQGKNGNHGR